MKFYHIYLTMYDVKIQLPNIGFLLVHTMRVESYMKNGQEIYIIKVSLSNYANFLTRQTILYPLWRRLLKYYITTVSLAVFQQHLGIILCVFLCRLFKRDQKVEKSANIFVVTLFFFISIVMHNNKLSTHVLQRKSESARLLLRREDWRVQIIRTKKYEVKEIDIHLLVFEFHDYESL